MTESEAKEIIERYEALLLEAVRAHPLADSRGDFAIRSAERLWDYQLAVEDGVIVLITKEGRDDAYGQGFVYEGDVWPAFGEG